jgi:dolichol-phosphate mannosyltransferase
MQLSMVIPTYKEKENLPLLLERVFSAFKRSKISGEVIIVDDNSPDGTGALANSLRNKYPGLSVIRRKGKLGLSSAVLEGFRYAKGDVLGVMDADLSHPPEAIPEMFAAIEKGADVSIGSRYVKGGGIEGWSAYRKMQSLGAVLLGRLFVKARDPMSGFFLVKKSCLKENLDPKGFKILLEILVKADCKNIREIPITFMNRKRGKSKLGGGEIFSYIENLLHYASYRRKTGSQFLKFAFVGFLGTLINLAVLYSLTEMLGIYYILSAVAAFVTAVTSNFLLNKVFTFRERLGHKATSKYLKFLVVSVLGLSVNLALLYVLTEFLRVYYLFSQVIAIVIAFFVNFFGNKKWTFSS